MGSPAQVRTLSMTLKLCFFFGLLGGCCELLEQLADIVLCGTKNRLIPLCGVASREKSVSKPKVAVGTDHYLSLWSHSNIKSFGATAP